MNNAGNKQKSNIKKDGSEEIKGLFPECDNFAILTTGSKINLIIDSNSNNNNNN